MLLESHVPSVLCSHRIVSFNREELEMGFSIITAIVSAGVTSQVIRDETAVRDNGCLSLLDGRECSVDLSPAQEAGQDGVGIGCRESRSEYLHPHDVRLLQRWLIGGLARHPGDLVG
jgi:hypothetical protein